MKKTSNIILALIVAFVFSARTHAQWVTETINLKTGWNAVYLHVDARHAPISTFAPIGGPIDEIWLWQPALSTAQFVQAPQQPFANGSQWFSWKSSEVANSLNHLVGNAAYLVRVSADHQWQVKGKPVPPKYEWTTTGLNFLGFPTAPVNPPDFDSFFAEFFAQSSEVRTLFELYYYSGSLSPVVVNNLELPTTPVTRGQAYWMRAGETYNRNLGPFEVSAQSGLDFGDSLGQRSFRLKNLCPEDITVTMKLLASELPVPDGQPNIVGVPTLLVRGDLNTSTLTYPYSTVPATGTKSWLLKAKGQPGAEIEVVLGINRYAMSYNAGDFLAGILRLTDSLGRLQVDLPLSAQMSSTAGLWIGNASVQSVNSYLKSYQKDANGLPVSDPNGTYIISGVNTASGPVMRPFPLRLMVHNTGSQATLLQRVFYGLDSGTNPIVTLKESNLDRQQLSSARRISAAHLPWTSGNTSWPLSGQFRQGSTLNTVVTVNYSDQAANPFLHTYHPDHDNLDATFQSVLPQGFESYTIARTITLAIQPPSDDFASLTQSGDKLGGVYSEEMKISGKGTESRNFTASGVFSMTRITPIATLTP